MFITIQNETFFRQRADARLKKFNPTARHKLCYTRFDEIRQGIMQRLEYPRRSSVHLVHYCPWPAFMVRDWDGDHVFIRDFFALQLDDTEATGIIAHELAHGYLNHGAHSPIFGTLPSLVQLWILRSHEYAADKFAAEVVGARAVHKALLKSKRVFGNDTNPFFPEWERTHPLIDKRLAALQRIHGRQRIDKLDDVL